MGAVDRCCANHSLCASQRFKHLQPDALATPAIEAVIDCRVGTVLGRAITPARTRAQHVHDPTDHTMIIHSVRTTPSARQQPFNARPLLLVQPIEMRHPSLRSVWKLESQNRLQENPLIEYRP